MSPSNPCHGPSRVIFVGSKQAAKMRSEESDQTSTRMWRGIVVSLLIAPEATRPMVSVEKVRAIPGRGLEGDRYFNRIGTYSHKPGPDREVTLIEIESVQALKRDLGIRLKPSETRRNIATSGVPLNHLVGQDFRIGEVRLRGIRLCEPCSYLESLTKQGVLGGLVHRGGLRAQILTGGLIRVGDVVQAS